MGPVVYLAEPLMLDDLDIMEREELPLRGPNIDLNTYHRIEDRLYTEPVADGANLEAADLFAQNTAYLSLGEKEIRLAVMGLRQWVRDIRHPQQSKEGRLARRKALEDLWRACDDPCKCDTIAVIAEALGLEPCDILTELIERSGAGDLHRGDC